MDSTAALDFTLMPERDQDNLGGNEDQMDQLRRILGDAALRQLGLYAMPADFLLSVVVPAYNEKATVAELLGRVAAVPIAKEILVVDDGSDDGTREILEKLHGSGAIPGMRLFLHQRNRGKGASLRTAFEHLRGDAVIIQDADLEYNPDEYRRLLRPIVEGRADVVFGTRFRGDEVRVHLFWHRVANGVLTTLSNLFTNLNLTDIETCYKAFRREALADIRIAQNRFGVEPELTAKIARRKYRVYEVPISYAGRDYAQGKKIGWRDALVAFYCIFRYGLAD